MLVSRIKALLKRFGKNGTEYIEDRSEKASNDTGKGKEDLIVDKDRFIVIQNDKELILPKKEFELLALLLSKPGKVFTREEIFNKVWGDNIVVGDRTIDVHIRKLREKLGDNNIKTIKGVGYKYA